MSRTLLRKISAFTFFAALITFFLSPDIAEARRGGRSFGGRRFSSPRRAVPPPSYKKSVPPSAGRSAGQQTAKTRSSFGGKRISSSREYTSKYGIPRKTSTMSKAGADGPNVNYRIHSYGGYGSGLMTGYMMGTATWMWMMPFHPAFYYSRPYEVHNKDGSVDVYPPTFNWSKLFFILLIIFVAAMIIRSVRGARKISRRQGSRGSFI